jgi:RecA-family ATPase
MCHSTNTVASPGLANSKTSTNMKSPAYSYKNMFCNWPNYNANKTWIYNFKKPNLRECNAQQHEQDEAAVWPTSESKNDACKFGQGSNVISIGKHCNVLITMYKVRIEAKIDSQAHVIPKVLWRAMRHRFPNPVCPCTIQKKNKREVKV